MVDWSYVDRRRADGAGWEEIAAEPASRFAADPSGPSPGRQLRALSRERLGRPGGALPAAEESPEPRRKWGPLVAWGAFAALVPWAFLAGVLPSPIGVYVPAIPVLGFLAAAAGAILAFVLFRAPRKWTPEFKRAATIGSVAGLLIAGSLGGVGFASGCPVLSPFLTSEPAGWQRVPQGNWSSGGAPVLYFFGSVACPYCSASSWAVLGALEALGNVSGIVIDHSSLTDVDPDTPSVVLADLTVRSGFVSLDARESTNDQQITAPSFVSCEERAYVTAYDPFGTVPFVTLGGAFVHISSLVGPGALSGLTGAQVESQLAAHNGSAYAAIVPQEDALLAYLVWLNHDRPASVAAEPGVASMLDQIH